MGAFRILIVDDHDAVRRGVRSLLSSRRDWSVCGEAIDGLEAVEKAKELRPDAVLMDISMPRMNGIEATRIIRKEVPECQVIMVSQNDPSALARQVAEVDAREYVLKADIARDLFPALERVLGCKHGNGHGFPAPEEPGTPSEYSLYGGGKLGQLIREHDWSATPLGPIHSWPQSLKTAVNLMLNSQHPMWIGWGEEMIFLYNDAYIPVLSQAKHPGSLGRRAEEVWAEIWDVCGPLAERVFSEGEPSFLHDVRLFMSRGDYMEETYYSFSYSPIYDDCGKVAGLFCPSSESTPRMLNARRLKTLAELSANALVEKSIPAASASGLATLGQNPDDIPFALLYLLAEDGKSVRLQSISRLPGEMTNIAPEEISLAGGSGHAQFWRIHEVVNTVQAQVVSVKGLEQLPLGPALQPVAEAIALPVTSRGQDRPVGVLIAGINPNRPLDVEYRTFFALVADQVATAIQNAKALEEERTVAIDNARLFQEARRAQAEAQITAERLRAIFDSAAVGVSILSKDARFLEINKTFCEMTGYSQEELLERDCEAITHPEDRVEMRKGFARMLAGEIRGFVMEVRYVRKDGNIIWVQKSVSLAHDAAGKPENIVALSQEITRRKLAEKATGLLAAIVESSEDAIITKDLSGVITSWNKSAERIFGYTAEEAVGHHITLIIPPDRLHEEDTILARIRRGQRVEHFDTVRMRKGGALVDIAPTISPVKDVSGRVVGASKVARDITERKQIERALAEQARRQRALFQLADQSHRAESLENLYDAAFQALSTGLECERAAILLLDQQSVMRFVSSRGLSDGYRKAVEGHSPWKATEKNPRPVCIPDVQGSDLDGALKATVGAEDIAALAFVPLVSDGKLIGKFMVYYDALHAFAEDEINFSLAAAHQLAFGIDRRRAEEALRESEDRYRRLAERLDAEVQLRTSELEQRTADVMRQSEQLRDLSGRLIRLQDEERRHIARELHDSAGQTLTVLGLTLARIKQQAKHRDPQLAGEVEECEEFARQLMREIRTTSYLLHPPLLDESGLAAALNWYVQGLAERSGLEITLTIAEDFGRLPGDLEVAIFRLVQECLTNVHRHSGSKSAVINITREQGAVRVEVQDHGKGMPPERLSQVQSQASSVGIRGMRERVRQFQGTMEIQSNKNGTRVLVEIPIAANQLADEEEGPQLEAAV